MEPKPNEVHHWGSEYLASTKRPLRRGIRRRLKETKTISGPLMMGFVVLLKTVKKVHFLGVRSRRLKEAKLLMLHYISPQNGVIGQ
jgi:hypothetical protein